MSMRNPPFKRWINVVQVTLVIDVALSCLSGLKERPQLLKMLHTQDIGLG